MDTQSMKSLKLLKHTIESDPLLHYTSIPTNCIQISSRSTASKRAAYNLKKIKISIINGERPGLILKKDAFTRRDMNTLTVCIVDKNNSYSELIQCLDPTEWDKHDLNNLKPLEHQ